MYTGHGSITTHTDTYTGIGMETEMQRSLVLEASLEDTAIVCHDGEDGVNGEMAEAIDEGVRGEGGGIEDMGVGGACWCGDIDERYSGTEVEGYHVSLGVEIYGDCESEDKGRSEGEDEDEAESEGKKERHDASRKHAYRVLP